MERSNEAEANHVVISGGSRGLGFAVVEALLRSGYAVSTFSRKGSEEIEELQSTSNGKLHFSAVDVSDAGALRDFVAASAERLGPIYGVINNSAMAVDGVLATLPEVEIQRMLTVNLDGAIRLTRLCLRTMLTGGTAGRIINISSIVGLRGYNGLTVYSATKGALDAFSRSLAREVGRRGITVNSIAPGYMRTAMSSGLNEGRIDQIVRRTPLGRLAELSDVVPAVEFLLSDAGSFITGHTLVIDGGVTC